jgi:nucleoside-diphosphate-sugar epimerase
VSRLSEQDQSPGKGSVVVLGANGRLGKAVLAAFHGSGWRVRAFVRDRYKGPSLKNLECVCGDALDQSAVTAAIRGFDVIVNALNVPYGSWETLTPKLTDVVTTAARHTGCTVMLPGNVYHFGKSMPLVLSESTHAAPSTALGRVRYEMEKTYARRSAVDGFKTIVLRAGDFFGGNDGAKSGGWLDSHIAAKFAQGKLAYPGPMDQTHAWAYLPDLANAMVALAARRYHLPQICPVGFPGFDLTGTELVHALERIAGRPLKVTGIPWWFVSLGSWFSGDLRGVLRMRYLWNQSHRIDGAPFHALLPNFTHTSLSSALSHSLVNPLNNKGINHV